jgi:hypothetical protein
MLRTTRIREGKSRESVEGKKGLMNIGCWKVWKKQIRDDKSFIQ